MYVAYHVPSSDGRVGLDVLSAAGVGEGGSGVAGQDHGVAAGAGRLLLLAWVCVRVRV